MGYTITFKLAFGHAKEIFDFMDSQMLKSKIPLDQYPYLKKSKFLSTGTKKGHVGYDCGPGDSRELCYALVHWMILRVGSEKFYYCDGAKTKIDTSRDSYGIRKNKGEPPMSVDTHINIEEEMHRLTCAWFSVMTRSYYKDSDTGGYIQ